MKIIVGDESIRIWKELT